MFVLVRFSCSCFVGILNLFLIHGRYDLNSTSEEREAVKTQKRLEKIDLL